MFHSRSFVGRIIVAGFAVLLVAGMATEAVAARKARAQGFYRVGRGQVNLPMQFVISVMTTPSMTAGIGMTGAHSIPLGFPNDDPMIDGDINLTGKGATLNVNFPQFLQSGSYSALLPLMGPANVQITSMFTQFKAPAATGGANFFAGGGPGAFTFCPLSPGVGAPGCYALGTGPPKGKNTQGTTRAGRVAYVGGAGFGGVSQVFLNGGGLTTRPAGAPHGFGDAIFWAAHEAFGMGTGMAQVIGGVDPTMTGLVEFNMLNGAIYTQPKTAPTTASSIITAGQAGPFVTVASGLTSCPGTFPNIPAGCVPATGPLLTGGVATTTNTGFRFTTGTVFGQQTTNVDNPDFFTITGSNGLNSKGIGNLVMAAGGLALRTNTAGVQPGASVDTISVTISEKTPSMSAGGFAAAALLMVLGAGYALRRRF